MHVPVMEGAALFSAPSLLLPPASSSCPLPPPASSSMARPVRAMWTGLCCWQSPPCAPSYWTGQEKRPHVGRDSESMDAAWPHPGSCASPARIFTSSDQQEQGSTYLQHAECGRHCFLICALNNFPPIVTT